MVNAPICPDKRDREPLEDSPEKRLNLLSSRCTALAIEADRLAVEAWALSTVRGDLGEDALQAAIQLRKVSRSLWQILDPYAPH